MSDLSSRYLLGCDAHPAISLERTFTHFKGLFATYGLPNRIRTDNGVPFASNALARLSQLSVWFIKLGIYPGLIEPGKPQQNGVHERTHRTLKQEATIPPGSSLRAQQRKLDRFREEFNQERPHEALEMKRPGGGGLSGFTANPAEADRALRLSSPLFGAEGEPWGDDPGASQADLCEQYPAGGLCGLRGGGRWSVGFVFLFLPDRPLRTQGQQDS